MHKNNLSLISSLLMVSDNQPVTIASAAPATPQPDFLAANIDTSSESRAQDFFAVCQWRMDKENPHSGSRRRLGHR